MGCAPSTRTVQPEFAGPDNATYSAPASLNRATSVLPPPTAPGNDNLSQCETSQSSVHTIPARSCAKQTTEGSAASRILMLARSSNAANMSHTTEMDDGDESAETVPPASIASPIGGPQLNHSLRQSERMSVGSQSGPLPATSIAVGGEGPTSNLSSTASLIGAQGYLPHQLTAFARLHRVFPGASAQQ